ncbi:MAG TPA: thioesterase family protein [Azospirillum sp.]|nr:thioesterase family protein [Azospirillum sp.]
MPDVTERPLADRARFKAWTTEKLRYCDTDRQGHINNAVFAEMLEAGRVHFLFEPGAPTAPPGCAFVIARMELDFLGEMNWPGTVDVGTAVLSIGRSSFRLGQGIFFNGACVGTAEAVIVLMDEATRRSAPLPDDFRARLESLQPV